MTTNQSEHADHADTGLSGANNARHTTKTRPADVHLLSGDNQTSADCWLGVSRPLMQHVLQQIQKTPGCTIVGIVVYF